MKRPAWHVAKYRTEYRGWYLEVFRSGDGRWWATCSEPSRGEVLGDTLLYPFRRRDQAMSAAERVARKHRAP
jgi:hypothetical protein